MKLLTNKIYRTTTNNWYAPTCEFHENHKSILRFVPMDTTSSSGDWSGFFIQKTGKHSAKCIGFNQENNYPHDGFTLYTAEHPFYEGDPTNFNFVQDAINCYLQVSYDKMGQPV